MPTSTATPTRKKGLHYGWVIVFAGFVIMCFVVCIVSNCVGLFVKPVSESLGISRQSFSLTTTFYSVAGMVLSMFMGRLYARFTIRRVMRAASVLLPAFYACYYWATNIYVFYAISFFCGVMGTCLTMIAISTLVSRWFTAKRGLAMALAATGSGIGGIFLNPIIGSMITNMGWRSTYLALAVLMAVTVIPCTFFLVKDKPSDMGLEPYGGTPQPGSMEADNYGMTVDQARRSPLLWLWLPVCTIVSASCTCIMQHTVSYVTDIGFSYAFAAGLASAVTASLAVGKLVMGQVFDNLGSLRAAYISLGCFCAAFALYCFAGNTLCLYLGVGIVGMGLSFSTVAYAVVTQDLFGKKDYASIYGLITVAGSLGGAIGSPAIATVYDMTGSYRPAWVVLCGLMVLCMVFITLAFRYKAKQAL